MTERPKPRPISFNVSVTESDWDAEMGGWRLTVLRLPGVRVDGIYVEGQRTDPGRFGVDSQQELLRWMPDPRPSRARIAVTITEELTTQKESDLQIESWRVKAERWKSLSAAFTATAAIVASLATFFVQHSTASERSKDGLASVVHQTVLSASPAMPEQPPPAAEVKASNPAPVASPSAVASANVSPVAAVPPPFVGGRSNSPPSLRPSPLAESRLVNNLFVEDCSDGDTGSGTFAVTFQKDGSASAAVVSSSLSAPASECIRKKLGRLRVQPSQATGSQIRRTIRLGNVQPTQDSRKGA